MASQPRCSCTRPGWESAEAGRRCQHIGNEFGTSTHLAATKPVCVDTRACRQRWCRARTLSRSVDRGDTAELGGEGREFA